MIYVNDEPIPASAGATVADVLAGLDIDTARRGIAVAVDAEVVPRGAWETHAVGDEARVEIVHAVQGG
ncbi:MAG: sulfur carrier protein ThiS [Solirubrobacterales bacterium]|nr:sulfur carrier protein ThiS [Solirubrobacterales bacterium]